MGYIASLIHLQVPPSAVWSTRRACVVTDLVPDTTRYAHGLEPIGCRPGGMIDIFFNGVSPESQSKIWVRGGQSLAAPAVAPSPQCQLGNTGMSDLTPFPDGNADGEQLDRKGLH